MNHIVERVYLDDEELKPQTIAHHLARYEFARKIRKVRRGDVSLDIACGSGYGTDMLRQEGYKSVGVDIDRNAISYAKDHFPLNKFIVCDIAEYGQKYCFDLAVMFEAIEHLKYTEGLRVLEAVQENLSSAGGVFILSTPRDIKGKYNELHKSQWDYTVLKNTLGSIFSDVKIYGQDWDTAIISEANVIENDFYITVCK